MQCYESEALRLYFFSEIRLLMPDTEYDPLAIDEVLDDSGVQSFDEYVSLEPGRRVELARRVTRLCPRAAPSRAA